MKQQPGIDLAELLAGLVPATTCDALRGIKAAGVSLDSRKVAEGGLFLAVRGQAAHGIEFLQQAIDNGAVAVLLDSADEQLLPQDTTVPCFIVDTLREKCSEIAARYYGHPSRDMTVIGVTGTDGKTSVSHYIAQCLHSDTSPCGLLGTLGNGLPGRLRSTGLTTADAVSVQRSLYVLRRDGARSAVMEVSSHGLDQARVAAVEFDCAVFTNLAQDHLDYHGDMASYAAAKERLFYQPGLRRAVINLDDPVGRNLAGKCRGRLDVWGCSCGGTKLSGLADHLVVAHHVQTTARGFEFGLSVDGQNVSLSISLMGRFNIANTLSVLAVLLGNGIALDEALRRLSALQPVPGRMQRIQHENRPLVVVDYAHTPQGLQAACEALREHVAGRLLCVFGCGGDRDTGKRPLMASVAEALADTVIITSDNPRSEDPDQIADDIMRGFSRPEKVYRILDRREAIEQAISLAAGEDVVLIAGKGHETVQLIGSERQDFDDARVAAALLEAMA